MTQILRARPLDAASFAPFGDVLEAVGAPDKIINQGLCGRFHDRAALDFAEGRAGISVFRAEPRDETFTLEMMERHPLGSQAFVPMAADPFAVIVAADAGGVPGAPQVFVTAGGQGVNYHRNVWHGVLTPLAGSGLFAVIDRIGDGENLQEHWFDTPYQVDIAP